MGAGGLPVLGAARDEPQLAAYPCLLGWLPSVLPSRSVAPAPQKTIVDANDFQLVFLDGAAHVIVEEKTRSGG
jgi:hypothetical protein